MKKIPQKDNGLKKKNGQKWTKASDSIGQKVTETNRALGISKQTKSRQNTQKKDLILN
jgi:hypothetical protein